MLSIPTLHDLGTIAWQDFERFATAVLRQYYKPFNLRLLSTPLSHDAGRDAHADHYLFAARPSKVLRSLATPFRLWVEVKKRSAANIGLDAIGKNLVRALNEDVAKLIIVTNGGFTKGMQEEVDKFAHRVRLDYCLLDGKNLLKLARSLDAPPTPSVTSHTTTVSNLQQKGLTKSHKPPPFSLRLSSSFTLDLADADFDPSGLSGEPDSPVFVAADVDVISCPSPSPLALSASLRQPNAGELLPYETHGTSEQRSIPPEVPVATGDRRRYAFILFPSRPGPLSTEDILFRASSGQVPIKIYHAAKATYFTRTVRMSPWIPPSRAVLIDRLDRDVKRWQTSGEVSGQLLLASAGAGKSHAIARLRRAWLTNGILEVSLDGQVHSTDLGIIKRVFERAFPLEPRNLGEDQTDAVATWLTRAGMAEARAREVAAVVCRNTSLDTVDAGLLADVAATLLRRLAVSSSVILLFEDVHKARPSALAFVREVQTRLRHCRVLFFLTSRYEPVSSSTKDMKNWYQGLEDLFPTFSHTQLPKLTDAEGVELLLKSIHTLEHHDAEAILEQVGTSPFGIREAVNYLIDYDIALFDDNLSEYRVQRREALRRALRLERFTQATRHRLQRLRERSPSWLGQFLDAASLLGRFFPLEPCLRTAEAPPRAQATELLGECEKLELLRTSPGGPDSIGFDHDLVRTAVLRGISAVQQRALAGNLLGHLQTSDDFVVGSLAYQAGFAERSVDCLSRFAATNARRGQHLDAIKALRVAIHTLDPSLPAGRQSATVHEFSGDIDQALLQAPPLELTSPSPTALYCHLLQLFRMLINSLTEIAGGGEPSMKAALSEAFLLARRLSDEHALAELESYEARWLFAQGRLNDSLEHHRKAEERYARLDSPALLARRVDNLVRLAISFRQVGDRPTSLRILQQAELLRSQDDLQSRVKILANTGALFFYSDRTQVRTNWEAALDTARASEIPDLILHALIDLAQVDVIEDKLSDARSRLQESLRIAERYGLESEHIRILLYFGCISLLEGELELSARHFLEAESLAVLGGNQRRLWRLRANMATIYELSDDLRRAYARDREVLDTLIPLITEALPAVQKGTHLGREFLGIANILLRARRSELHLKLRDIIHPAILKITDPIVRAAISGELGTMPNLLGQHCKTLAGGIRRFVVTE